MKGILKTCSLCGDFQLQGVFQNDYKNVIILDISINIAIKASQDGSDEFSYKCLHSN